MEEFVELWIVPQPQRVGRLTVIGSSTFESMDMSPPAVPERTPAGAPPSPPPPPPKKPGNMLSGDVMNSKAISLPKPVAPAEAIAAKASGAVVVEVIIDEKGNVISAKAVSGPETLRAASEAAARQAKFSPTLLAGTPVKVSGRIVYNFVQ